MQTIYRYENIQGVGPYHAGYVALATMLEEHGLSPEHPAWNHEGWCTTDRNWFAGCLSLESLQAWFFGWTDLLEQCGFRVVCYQIPEENLIWCPSGKQIIFIKP